MCDVLVGFSNCGEGNFTSFGGGVGAGDPLSLCQWLSCFSKGLGSSSLVALGSGVSQSLWHVWDSLSRCGVQAPLYLWQTALI